MSYMPLMLAQNLAEAGMDLAGHSTPRSCIAALVGHAIDLTDAAEAAFVGIGTLDDIQVGTPPEQPAVAPGGHAAGDILVDDDVWIAILVRAVTGDTRWSGVLWIRGLDGDAARRVAQTLARQAGLALTTVLHRSELEMRARQHLALVEAGKSLSQEVTLQGVLHRIIELATELVDAKYGALGVVDPETGQTLTDFVTVGLDDATRAKIGDLPTGKGILGVLIHDPKPLRMARLADDPRSAGFPPHHPPMESFLGVPIQTRRETKGRIYLTEKQGASAFSAEDEQIVVTLASQAGIAIENADLYETLQHTADELSRVNEQLTAADQHKSAFLASMSHELRSPLNTILGYTRLLLDDVDNVNEEQREDLSIIQSSGRHLLGLITDLLDMSKIETGTVELHLEMVDIAQFVHDIANAMRPQIEDAGLDFSVSVSEGIEIECDSSRLRQMFLNVLGNAVKFTEHGGIVLTVEHTGDRITTVIRDTGSGIPEPDLERIFESFYQSQAAMARTPRAQEGAGLGLAITRMLAELHHGTVSIESRLGHGTSVTIDLPLRQRPRGVAENESTP